MRPSEFDRVRFGEDIWSVRTSRGLSLREVEPLTGVSFHAVGDIENGRMYLPGTAIILAAWADLDLRTYVRFNLTQERRRVPRHAGATPDG